METQRRPNGRGRAPYGNPSSSGNNSQRRPGKKPSPFLRGNKSWNNSKYAMSVRTRRTATKVITPGVAKGPRQDFYYDNTPAAVHSRQRQEFKEKSELYLNALRKNKRLQKIKRSLIFTATALITFSILFSFVYKQFFVVGNISVTGNTKYSEEEVSEASGLISAKTNLYSFSSSATGSKMRFLLPYISHADFHRTAPNKVSITVTEEKAVFYADIYGELYSISSSLRVLEPIGQEEAAAEGLIKLKLQPVSSAVAGSELCMVSERAERYLRNIVNILSSSALIEKLDSIDLTDDFDTVMVADGKYKLDFGTQEDFSVKVRLAVEILDNAVFDSGNKAYINLKNTSETSVIIDNQLELD